MSVERFCLKFGNKLNMARIKDPIKIPQGVQVAFDENTRVLKVSGPKGVLERPMRREVDVSVDGDEIKVAQKMNTRLAKSLSGTYFSHAKNMVKGVTDGYLKSLIVEGVGYRSEMKGDKLALRVGFSHPVEIDVDKDLSVSVKDNVITIEGFDKEKVGEFAASVRAIKKPEPYKGKGIRYSNEVVRRKQGKKSVT